MGTSDPQFRANWTKLVLKFARQRPDEERDRILAAIGAATLARVKQAGMFDWLPATVHMAVVGAIHEELGASARLFWRELMAASLQRSLLKPLLDGGIRLFGRSAHSVLRMTPQAMQLIARGCGDVRVERGAAAGSVVLTFAHVPAELRSPSWAEVCAGNCEGVLDILGLVGVVTLDADRLGGGTFVVVTTPRG